MQQCGGMEVDSQSNLAQKLLQTGLKISTCHRPNAAQF